MSGGKNDDADYASPACSLPEAPETYAFAKKLSDAEIAALLDRLLVCVGAGKQDEARRLVREALPLVADDALRAMLAGMAEAGQINVAEVERVRGKITAQ